MAVEPEKADPPRNPSQGATGRFAFWVAAGIFLSRVAGLIRDRVFAHYFGNSEAADAFRAAFRIPNFLQNLFGEGVLSASFIPVYAGLIGQGKREEAKQVAGAVLGLLSLLTALLVAAGVLTTPWLIDAIAPGFTGGKRELAILLVRILFPGAGLFVVSAWCLGILNSHRKFFLSYSAPVIWNAAIIAVLVAGGSNPQNRLAVLVAWGSVAGSLLQFLVQVPAVVRCLKGLCVTLNARIADVRTVIRNFVPVFLGRGAVQISAYVDSLLASLLPTGAVAAMAYAQTLYLLPVSLFGMSVSAAELPVLSEEAGADNLDREALRRRIGTALRRIGFFVVPSSVAMLALGDLVSGAIYQTGRFTRDDAVYVWGILAGAAAGLPATTFGRLLASVFYAFRNTRTPLLFSVLRICLCIALGIPLALWLPGRLGMDPRWGVAGLTVAAGIVGWVEFFCLKRSLGKRIGGVPVPWAFLGRLLACAAAGAGAGWLLRPLCAGWHPLPGSLAPLAVFGVVFGALAVVFRFPEISRFLPARLR